jgi:hypothetical protein
MLQKECEKLQTYYLGITKKGLTLSYFSRTWLNARGVFIPKKSKEDDLNHQLDKMTTLTSFQLKEMERLIHWFLISILETKNAISEK